MARNLVAWAAEFVFDPARYAMARVTVR